MCFKCTLVWSLELYKLTYYKKQIIKGKERLLMSEVGTRSLSLKLAYVHDAL